jgi:hypothetical protein
MNEIDYNDDVILLGYERGRITPAKTVPTVLWEAVRIVIEEWPEDLHPSVYRVRGGAPIRDLATLRQIYGRPDFPKGA